MKKLILYIVVIFSLTGASCFGIFLTNPVFLIANDYYHAIEAKAQRLKSLGSPKIILVGGSNLAFGINSKRISDAFKLPVANMGIGAAFGLEFDLNQIRPYIGEGDLVVISDFPDVPNYETIYQTYYYCPETIRGIRSAGQYYKLVKGAISAYTRSIQNTAINGKRLTSRAKPRQTIDDHNSIYFKAGFNEYGDLVSHLNNIKPSSLGDRGTFGENFASYIALMNEFKIFAESKKATVVYSAPPYPASERSRDPQNIESFNTALRKGLQLRVIGGLHGNIFPDSLFFDTIYHLDSAGRELRTNKLISSLHKAMKIRESKR